MRMSGQQKRAWRKWDDVEERLLAAGVKQYGTKGAWDKIQQHMCTDRTTKQLSDHWVDRQEQCKRLLEELGPAPRPNRPSIAAQYNNKAEAEGMLKGLPGDSGQKLQGQATLLTRVPSLRYRFHPYQRDDRLQQAVEASEVDRVREALGRYLTHIQWLEDVLAGARPGAEAGGPQTAPSQADNGAAAGQEEGGGRMLGNVRLQAVGGQGKVVVYDNETLAVQEGLLKDMMSVIEAAEDMGVWNTDKDVTADISPQKGLTSGQQDQTVSVKSEAAGAGSGSVPDDDEQPRRGLADKNFCLPGHVREVASADVRRAVEAEWKSGRLTDNIKWVSL